MYNYKESFPTPLLSRIVTFFLTEWNKHKLKNIKVAQSLFSFCIGRTKKLLKLTCKLWNNVSKTHLVYDALVNLILVNSNVYGRKKTLYMFSKYTKYQT